MMEGACTPIHHASIVTSVETTSQGIRTNTVACTCSSFVLRDCLHMRRFHTRELPLGPPFAHRGSLSPLTPLFLPLTPPRCLTDTTTVAPDFGPTERMSLTISGRRASSAMGRAQELALIMCGTTTVRNLICKGTRTTSFATQLLGTVRTRQSLILVEETGQRRRRPSLTAQDDALSFLDLNHRRSRRRNQNPRRRRLVMRRAGTHPLLHRDRKDLR